MGVQASISPLDLSARIGTARSPSLFDVRRTASFEADDTVMPRCDATRSGSRMGTRPIPAGLVVVYRVHGHEV